MASSNRGNNTSDEVPHHDEPRDPQGPAETRNDAEDAMVEKQERGFGEHGIDKVCDLHGEEALSPS